MAGEQDFLSQLRIDISKIVRLQRAYFQRHRLPLPPSLASILATIDSFGPSTPTRLAALEGVRLPPISRAIASLEEQGLVRRETDPSDGRQVMIHLTPTGLDSLDAIRGRVAEWMEARFAGLDEKDKAAIRRASSAIHRLAETGEPSTSPARPGSTTSQVGPDAKKSRG
jgi:DNA-binding MarR family transcriptional regulator